MNKDCKDEEAILELAVISFFQKQASLVQSIQFTVYAYDDVNGPQAKVIQLLSKQTNKQTNK